MEEQKNFRLHKIKFLVRVIMLIHRIQLFMMNTSCPYITQQPYMLETGFKNPEKEFNHILGLSKAKENPLVTFYKD